eukprot:7376632-Prymnesium_polylepis.2
MAGLCQVTNQQCGAILIKHVTQILIQQGKGTNQALQVTRHIVDNYDKQGRLKHLYDHRDDHAWIGKWVTRALSKQSAVRSQKRSHPLESVARAVTEAAEDGQDSEAAAWAMAAAAMGATPPEPKKAKAAAAKLSVDQYKRGILVRGETHRVKELIKYRIGGLSWNPTLGGWIGVWAQRERIISSLRACPEVELTVTFDKSAEQAPPLEGYCNVCRDRPARMVLMPCGHQCCCSTCVPGLKGKCPICRASFNNTQKIFLAGAY